MVKSCKSICNPNGPSRGTRTDHDSVCAIPIRWPDEHTTYSILTLGSDSTRITLEMVDNDKESCKYFIANCNQGNYNLECYCDGGGYEGLYGACLAYTSLLYGGGCGIPVELVGYGYWFGAA